MGTLELTVHVLNISPGVTLADLNNFFSYCGTVDKIHIINYSRSSSSGGGNNNNKNNKTSALVSFRQPYAFQTALLLNEATLGDGPISILPAGVIQIPIIDSEREEGLLQSAAGSVGGGGGGGGVAELAAERLCVWLSRVYEKASNFATSQLFHSNALNPNSTKQK